MNLLLAIVGFAAALGPIRQAHRLADLSRPRALLAAAATGGLLVLLAALSGPLLESGDVSPPTARIGAGLALAATSLLRLLRPVVADDEGVVGSLDHPVAAMVPATFPVLFQPVVAMMAVAVGAERGASATILAALPTLVVWLALVTKGSQSPWGANGTRLLALLGLPAAVAMMVGGVFAL